MTQTNPITNFCDQIEQRLNQLNTSFRQVHRAHPQDPDGTLKTFFAELFSFQTWFQQNRTGLTSTTVKSDPHYELLYKSGLVLQAATEAPKLLELALDTLLDMCCCGRGFIAGLNQKGLDQVVARDFEGNTIPPSQWSISRSVVERTQRLKSEVTLDQEDSLLQRTSLIQRGDHGLICVPVLSDDEVAAVIYLDHFHQPLALPTFALVRQFSKQLGMYLKTVKEFTTLKMERERLQVSLKNQGRFDHIISKNVTMMRLLKTLAKVAPTDAPVLIEGETGTGKDLIARAVHTSSKRSSGPYIEVDCGALPANLIESELFGHVRGAFTGAQADRVGLMEAAHGGTLFLDEINNLPLASQTKLLRVLQNHKLRRIGETRERPVDFRLVTATSRTVKELVEEGTFRSDLYYRINTVSLSLPPLRERKDDIYVLALSFLSRFAEAYGRENLRLEPETLLALEAHDWPGNVRELEHVLERAVILAEQDHLTLSDLPEALGGVAPTSQNDGELSLEDYINRAKKYYITKILNENKGNKAEAARRLKVNRSHLFGLIKQLEVERAAVAEEPRPPGVERAAVAEEPRPPDV